MRHGSASSVWRKPSGLPSDIPRFIGLQSGIAYPIAWQAFLDASMKGHYTRWSKQLTLLPKPLLNRAILSAITTTATRATSAGDKHARRSRRGVYAGGHHAGNGVWGGSVK